MRCSPWNQAARSRLRSSLYELDPLDPGTGELEKYAATYEVFVISIGDGRRAGDHQNR